MQATERSRTAAAEREGTTAAAAGAAAVHHAFDGGFLARLLAAEAPPSAAAAALAGPWEVVPRDGDWAVVDTAPAAAGAAAGGVPAVAAHCAERQDALLIAAALPGHAAGPLRLAERPGSLYGDGRGYELRDGGRPVGSLAWFDTRLVETLAALRALVASPHALALLLEAAGHDALDRAGRLLAARVAESAGEGDGEGRGFVFAASRVSPREETR